MSLLPSSCELESPIRMNLGSRGWLPLCQDLVPPSTLLIREFYANLSIKSDYSGSHILFTWIWGEEFRITKKIVSKALRVPLVCNPTYPYNSSPPIDDVMSLLCSKPVTRVINMCSINSRSIGSKFQYVWLIIFQEGDMKIKLLKYHQNPMMESYLGDNK